MFDLLPNVCLSSGDETRKTCEMDLLKDIMRVVVDKFRTRIRRICGNNYVVPIQHSIFISCLDRRIRYDVYDHTTTDEILNVITGWVNAVCDFEDCDFYVMSGCKPLRSGFLLKDFGIINGSHLTVQLRLRGGCRIDQDGKIAPYSDSIVIEESFGKNVLQSGFEVPLKKVFSMGIEEVAAVISKCLPEVFEHFDGRYVINLLEDLYFMYEDIESFGYSRGIVRFLKYRGFKTIDFLDALVNMYNSVELQSGEHTFGLEDVSQFFYWYRDWETDRKSVV